MTVYNPGGIPGLPWEPRRPSTVTPCPDLDAFLTEGLRDSNGKMAEARRSVRLFVDGVHRARSRDPIHYPDQQGCFPYTRVANVPSVVVDANTLRNDVCYACRNERQATTLIATANSGLVHLFCAGHVLDEVEEHYEEWCADSGLHPEEFVSVWFHNYAPLLRAVSEVPEGLLSDAEQARIETLRRKDKDDIPSVTLALLLGAFYMSEDGNASEAVYGTRRANEELRAWREVLCASGDAGTLDTAMNVVGNTVAVVGQGLWAIFDRLTPRMPTWARLLILGLIGVGTGAAVRYLPEDRQLSLGNAAVAVGHSVTAFGNEHSEALDRLRRAQPIIPTWAVLGDELPPECVLIRACLHTLARSNRSHRSAVELARDLPDLTVAKGEAKVRSVLRSTPAFNEVYAGRWQVGQALVKEPIAVDEE